MRLWHGTASTRRVVCNYVFVLSGGSFTLKDEVWGNVQNTNKSPSVTNETNKATAINTGTLDQTGKIWTYTGNTA
ncbi:hypothetical protein GGS20DRAFT_571618 [Poronia punctata]|nr:hypothetical protein GGS20DRAFT_571618 [Poronia punctata]